MNQLSIEQIRLLRQTRYLSQKQMAANMKITKQRYSELEILASSNPETLERLLKVLGYTYSSAKKFFEAIPPHPPRRKANTKKAS